MTDKKLTKLASDYDEDESETNQRVAGIPRQTDRRNGLCARHPIQHRNREIPRSTYRTEIIMATKIERSRLTNLTQNDPSHDVEATRQLQQRKHQLHGT